MSDSQYILSGGTATGQSVHDVQAQATLTVGGKDVSLWLRVRADPLMLNGKPHVVALNNITERKQAGTGEQASPSEFLKIIDQATAA